MAEDERTVHEFARNDKEVVRAVVSTFKGKRYCSLRIFYREGNGGRWLPSKKGLTLAVGHIPDLVQAVRKLEEAAQHDGTAAPF